MYVCTSKHPAAMMALVSLAYRHGGREERCRVDTLGVEAREYVSVHLHV